MLLIRKGRILKGKHWIRVNIVINESGKIVDIYKSDNVKQFWLAKVNNVYNAKEFLLLPGIIDMHVHFREPGFEWKEDFLTGSKSAIAGGVTIIADMPNNDPKIDSFEMFKRKFDLIKDKSYCDFLLYVGLPKNSMELEKFLKVKNSFPLPAGVKVYLYNAEEEDILIQEDLPRDFLYVIHAEDHRYLTPISDCESYSSFEKSRPREAEISAVKKIIEIARKKQLRFHIAHLSSYEALIEIIKAKREGIKITAEVTPHHLILNKELGEKLKGVAKCYPPLRTELDRRMLWRGVLSGYIDAIASDHAPHAAGEKLVNLCKASPGINGVQLLLPLIYTLIKKTHVRDLEPIINALTRNPAKILGLKNRGKIKIGFYADIIIFNPRKEWKVTSEVLFSKSSITPYEGMRVKGWVKATFLRGKLVYEDMTFLKKIGTYATILQ